MIWVSTQVAPFSVIHSNEQRTAIRAIECANRTLDLGHLPDYSFGGRPETGGLFVTSVNHARRLVRCVTIGVGRCYALLRLGGSFPGRTWYCIRTRPTRAILVAGRIWKRRISRHRSRAH